MSAPRIAVGIVVQNEAETIEKSLASYYDHVERIVVSTDLKRGWSGLPITPDNTIDLIRAFDKDKKVDFLFGDYCRISDAHGNETIQRQELADRVSELAPDVDWVLQIDADEEFVDFSAFREKLGTLPKLTRGVHWRWIVLYNQLPDGRMLVVTDAHGKPELEKFALGHRPGAKMRFLRTPTLPPKPFRTMLPFRYEAPADLPSKYCVLHYTWAKSEPKLREKLTTWGLAHDVDADALLEQWRNSTTNWETMRNFHPTNPAVWPALRPFTLEELRAG